MIRSRAVNGIVWVMVALAVQVWPGLVKPAHGQGSRKDDIVFNSRGVPLAGATVRVCAMPATGQPCTPLAQIYSDPGLTQAVANPTTTDGMGNYYFYAAPGKYELEFSGPGITTKQVPNVILPSDPSSPTFSSLSTTGGISAFTLNLSGNLTVNGSTTVVGNLASGTLNLTNQGSAPGTPTAGTVNLYTKSTDKRLYYKDETGTEIGPIANASGAQTNQTNTFTAVQNFDADVHTKGPNPWYDLARFGAYFGANYDTPTTGTISSGSNSLSVASAMDFANGQGILVWGAGPSTGLPTPQAPTVTPLWQQGSTSYSYCIASVDYYGGVTPCGAAGSTSTGPSSFGMKTYSVSSESSTGNGTTVTVTTSTPHNIPTTFYHGGQWPQVEFTGSGNAYCTGAVTLTGVPSSTTVTYTRQGVADTQNCGTPSMNVLPEMEVKWANYVSLPVTNYACNSGGTTATITVPTFFTAVYGAWPGSKFSISGSSDSTYNNSFSGYPSDNTHLTFNVSCSPGSDSGNFGGTYNAMMSHAVKAHLIYRCTGGSCALPANAANYALVGVAQGDDTYFVDKGYGITCTSGLAAGVDQGQYPCSAAPTTATNQYLDTTITAGAGTTTLTLATAAASSVTNAKTWHDNVPNVYQACAAIPSSSGAGSNGGTLYIGQPAIAGGYTYAEFPIIANLIARPVWANPVTYNCSGAILKVAAPIWMRGTVEWNGGLFGVAASVQNGIPQFYGFPPMTSVVGLAYPMFHFETNLSGGQTLSNLTVIGNGNYQIGMLWDMSQDGGGTSGWTIDNVHTSTNNTSAIGAVIKAGFGWFYTQGGWGASQSDYASGRSLLITVNCGSSAYQVSSNFPYIFRARSTYGFGTAEVDSCGNTSASFTGYYDVFDQLEEGARGPQWKFNTYPTAVRAIRFDGNAYDDFTGGTAVPLFDFTNSVATSVEVRNGTCGSSTQPLLEVNPNWYNSFKIEANAGSFCSLVGIDPVNNSKGLYSYEALQATTDYKANWVMQLQGPSSKVGAGQVANPSVAPTVTVSTSCTGYPSAGTYTYAVAAIDATGNPVTGVGGYTLLSPNSTGVSLNGTSQCAVIHQPTLPVGAAYWEAFATSGGNTGAVYIPGSGCSIAPSIAPLSTTTIIDQTNAKCGSAPTVNTTSLQI